MTNTPRPPKQKRGGEAGEPAHLLHLQQLRAEILEVEVLALLELVRELLRKGPG